MKKLTLLVILLLSIINITAQEWMGINKSAPAKIKETLVSSSEEEIVVDVKVSGFFQRDVKTSRGNKMVISGEGMVSMLKAGAPDLPMYPISMIIGDKAEMKVSVVKSEYVDFENIEVAPSKGNFSRQINPDDVEYAFGEMYSKNTFYPSEQVTLENPYILRDFRGQNMMIYPYAYNPVTKTLRVYTDLRISVKKVSDNGVNQKVSSRRTNKIDPEMRASYKRRFINYPSKERYDFLEEEGEMLIVCVDKYIDALQPLVKWKNISGRPTTIVGTSVTKTDEKLKTYLQNYYKENPELVYVLLVGEHENLPGHSMNGGRSDNYFGMLEGDDFYEEVFVGRLPVSSLEDATNQVNKIIYYERDIDETATWLSKGTGIAAKEGFGHNAEYDYKHMDFIRDTLLNYTYTEVSQHYDFVNDPTVEALVEEFNSGVGIVNYCNHGTAMSWTVTEFTNNHIHQLTNDYMLPFIWSVACYNGQFNYNECFGEAWMRAMNEETGAPTGAVGGMFSWILQPWMPPMYGQDEMINILAEYREGYKHTLAGASLNGNMYILDVCPEDNGDTHNTWLLFGDPSMMLRTETPKKMNVTTLPETLLSGMTNLTVNADTEFGIATLSVNDSVIASSYVENGIANITFPALTEVGKAKLVVVGYNRVAEMLDINILPSEGGYIVVDSFELNQEDGQIDYNEYIDLGLNVKNIGVEETSNVTLELSTDSEYIKMIDSLTTITSIDVDEVLNLDKEFRFYVRPDAPNETKINFILTCSSESGSYRTNLTMEAYAPDFVLNDISVIPENGALPGQKASLKLSFDNVGGSSAYDVLTELFAGSSEIEFENTLMKTSEVKADETVTFTTDFTLPSSAVVGSVYDIVYNVGAKYHTLNSTYSLSVGSLKDNFETGDFSHSEWINDEQYPWVIDNVNPYEGIYCAKSAAISHGQISRLKIKVDVTTPGEISFYRKVSSELNTDYLAFILDGFEKDRWSGNVDWDLFSFKLSKGSHTIEIRYVKDKENSDNEDCAWIDFVSFPPKSVVAPLDAVTNLKAKLQDAAIMLSWDDTENADEYIVRRDGEIISTQTETSFADNIESGIYTYSVVAKIGDSYSAPAFVIFDPDKKSTESVMEFDTEKISIYPNPASGMLYVKLDKSFEAIVYNYQGQVVMRKYINNGQIDISSFNTGIYFLEIRNGDNVKIEKFLKK